MGSRSVTCNTATVNFPAFTPAEAGTRFSDPGGMQDELTWMVVIAQDSLPAKDGHLRNNRAVSWLGIEPATEIRKFNDLTTTLAVV